MTRLLPLFGSVLLTVFLLTSKSLVAQSVLGILRDGETRQPISGGVVSLLTEDGAILTNAESDSLGAFDLTAPGPGSYFIRAERIGYETKTDGILALGPRGEIEIAFYLLRTPIELEGINVEVEGVDRIEALARRRLRAQGFHERQPLGTGHFLTPEELDVLSAMSPREVFQRIPGVSVLTPPGVAGQVLWFQCTVRPGGAIIQPMFGGFVDGVEVFRGEYWDITMDVRLEDILAIETYTSRAELPIEYARLGLCGVVLIWTK